jgi:type II secretory ATPase GspE/PulE/Tfp pilus assembly ATPase PilB-like protein
VRVRVDGVVRPGPPVPRALGLAVASRLKILAGLDIADRLRPQDGRAQVRVGAGGAAGGGAARLVAPLRARREPRAPPARPRRRARLARRVRPAAGDAERLERLLASREGLILVTGPTGSGKTTTLYAALGRVLAAAASTSSPSRTRSSAGLPGVVQVQTHERAGLSFAAALRAILRQDPDVVLVGEVRDRETAAVARRRRSPGTSCSPPCTRSTPWARCRGLADVGVEPFKLAAALRGVVAQRLVRRSCAACRVPVAPGWTDARLLGRPPTASRPGRPAAAPRSPVEPCDACGGAGLPGTRAPRWRCSSPTRPSRGRVAAGDGPDGLRRAARAGGTTSVWASAVGHVRAGHHRRRRVAAGPRRARRGV